MRTPSAMLPFALTLAFIACSGDGSSGFTAAAADLVPETLLTLDDLPSGWEPLDPDADIAASLELSSACDILDPSVLFPNAAAVDRSDTLGGRTGQQLISFGAIYPSEEAAAAAMAGTQEIADRCEGEFKDTAEQLAKDQLDVLGIDLGIFAGIDVTLGDLEVPAAGADGSLAYRLQVTVGVPGSNQRFTLDVLLACQGRTVGAATYATFGEPTPADDAAIIDALAANLADVDARLP